MEPVTIVQSSGGEWQTVYLGKKMVMTGAVINPVQLLDVLGIKHREVEREYEWFEEHDPVKPEQFDEEFATDFAYEISTDVLLPADKSAYVALVLRAGGRNITLKSLVGTAGMFDSIYTQVAFDKPVYQEAFNKVLDQQRALLIIYRASDVVALSLNGTLLKSWRKNEESEMAKLLKEEQLCLKTAVEIVSDGQIELEVVTRDLVNG